MTQTPIHKSPNPPSKLKSIDVEDNEKDIQNQKREESPIFNHETGKNVFVSNPSSYATSPQNRSVEATPTRVVIPKS